VWVLQYNGFKDLETMCGEEEALSIESTSTRR